MLTDSIVSAGGMYIWWCGSATFDVLVPSVQRGVGGRAWPFTLMLSERCGVSVSAFGSVGGSEPGTSTTSA